MSTITFGLLTSKRDAAEAGTSKSKSPPGVNTFVDALAALVPVEVLTLHGLIISATTKTDNATTQITAPGTLWWSFWGLIVFSILIYVGTRFLTGKLDWWDLLRVLIPPLAFVGWTMLQRSTAFDAVFPDLGEAPRTVTALFLAAVLGFATLALASKADQKQPRKARTNGADHQKTAAVIADGTGQKQ